MHTGCWWEREKERDLVEDGTTILKCILEI
jgi:hypothetical protein